MIHTLLFIADTASDAPTVYTLKELLSIAGGVMAILFTACFIPFCVWIVKQMTAINVANAKLVENVDHLTESVNSLSRTSRENSRNITNLAINTKTRLE